MAKCREGNDTTMSGEVGKEGWREKFGMRGAGGDGDPVYSRPEQAGSGPWAWVMVLLSVQQLRSAASIVRGPLDGMAGLAGTSWDQTSLTGFASSKIPRTGNHDEGPWIMVNIWCFVSGLRPGAQITHLGEPRVARRWCYRSLRLCRPTASGPPTVANMACNRQLALGVPPCAFFSSREDAERKSQAKGGVTGFRSAGTQTQPLQKSSLRCTCILQVL